MKSQCEGTKRAVDAPAGATVECPYCGNPTLVISGSVMRTHSINGGFLGGKKAQHIPKAPTVRVREDHFPVPLRDFFLTRPSKFSPTPHRVEITQTHRGRMEWRCLTCKRAGVTTAGYREANLVAQARLNHYQQVRNAARVSG